MQMNHHIMAKTTTDSILSKFKSEEWKCCDGIGKDFFRVATDATFPSPDAAFYDENRRFLVSFEFKPPTETKRGILTGVGQSIAYLQECNISYLIAPEYLEDYNLGVFLTELFQNQIYGKIPSGLILYKNNQPEDVRLVSNIAESIDTITQTNVKSIPTSRFWAKHIDLPIPFFHLLLHCYFLKKSHTIEGDAYKYCWKNYMLSPTILTDFQPKTIKDCSNRVIRTLAGAKDMVFMQKTLKKTSSLDEDERREIIRKSIDTESTGDNMYQSYRKNYVTFLKHLKVIDSEGDLTESGFKLYHLGLVNGASSKVFQDYFTKEVLTTGHHLDLILDLDKIIRENSGAAFSDCLRKMEALYEAKGFIKRNPNRRVGETSKVGFLKYECILWRALGLLVSDVPNHYYINWKVVTEICSLPDL